MVADYSSYLEFIGAVYFTMSLSEYLTSKIWNVKDTKKFDRALDGLGMKDDTDFKDAVLAANSTKGKQLQAELSKKSLIGLFVISFLLIYSGYEQSIKDTNDADALSVLHLELSYSCIYFIVTLFFLQWVVFKKWKYVVFYISSIVGFFSLVRLNTWVYNCYDIEKIMIDYIDPTVCIIVSIPILWQIFIIWIHKSVFYGYVKSKIKEAQRVYGKVQECVKNGQYDLLPPQYYEIYMRNSQTSRGTTPQQILDDSLTEYKGALYNDIRIIGLKVRLYQLLFSWFRYRGEGLIAWLKNLCKNKGVARPKKLMIENYADYAETYKKMRLQNKKLNMSDFCKMLNISYEEFKGYYSKHCEK